MLCCRYFGHGEWFAPTFAPPSALLPGVMTERYSVPFVARELSEPHRPQTNEPQPPGCRPPSEHPPQDDATAEPHIGDGVLHVPQAENMPSHVHDREDHLQVLRLNLNPLQMGTTGDPAGLRSKYRRPPPPPTPDDTHCLTLMLTCNIDGERWNFSHKL